MIWMFVGCSSGLREGDAQGLHGGVHLEASPSEGYQAKLAWSLEMT